MPFKTPPFGAPIVPVRITAVGLVLSFTVAIISIDVRCAIAQGIDRDRVNAQRYLTVLMRRPRPGVALDRVYGYHVQNDSLGELEKQLTAEPATGHMIWGLIQLQRGKAAAAVEQLELAEQQRPDDAACAFYLGRALLAIGQTGKAAEAMERAIDRGPSRTEALPMFTELGRIYSRAGQRDKSLSVWTRLETLFPGDMRVGGQIAKTLADEGNYEAAKERFEKLAASARNPNDKVTFAVRAAEMQRQLGQTDQATQKLEMILAKLRPGSWLHSNVRGRIEAGFLRSGDYDGLAGYYEKRLETNPDDLSLRTRLSQILVTAGRLVDAKEMLTSAVQRAPDDIDLRLALIEVLLAQSDIAEASKQFEALTKIDPGNPDVLIRWGQVVMRDSKIPEDQRRSKAADIWMRLVKTRRDDPVLLSQVADQLRGIERVDDAIKLYRQAIELDPSAPQYREYLGEYLFTLDRKDEAIDIWKSIAADDRRGRDTLVRLAEVFGTFKQDELALQAWKDASGFDLNFAQELRYASKLTDAQHFNKAIERLNVAAKIAETPDEQSQLLARRIKVYDSSGTLKEQIEKVAAEPESIDQLRTLALMQNADGDLVGAEQSIRKATKLEPDNPDVLLVSAELAERQNRFVDAVKSFKQLAEIDRQYRTNFLQRVAQLQMRLGQSDQAMETCQAIIDTNPASTESYQFFARSAFDIGRDEGAVAALRKAMTVAPRDNLPRRMLSNYFARVIRTDEAIELLWQAFALETSTEDRLALIRTLGPLYDRRNDLGLLISRIDEVTRTDNDKRIAAMMTSAAYESVQDFGAARSALEPVLVESPRDLKLLTQMVQLCDAAGEVELASDYQARMVDLAATPENRFRLLQLQLESGEIDFDEALSKRLATVSDPKMLGRMVSSAYRRGDAATAEAICRQTLKRDDSLWDIKLTLAQLLMLRNVSDEQTTRDKEALTLFAEIRNADFEWDQLPPTQASSTQNSTNRRTSGYNPARPQYWTQAGYQVARALRIGSYAQVTSSSSTGIGIVEPFSFGHARVIARMYVELAKLRGVDGQQAATEFVERYGNEIETLLQQQTSDVDVYWESLALAYMPYYLGRQLSNSGQQSTQSPTQEKHKQWVFQLTWRIAERDPEDGVPFLVQMLSQRMAPDRLSPGQRPNMDPLDDAQLELLRDIRNRFASDEAMAKSASIPGMTTSQMRMQIDAVLANEYRLAGKQDQAAEFELVDMDGEPTYDELFSAIQFYIRLEEMEKAESLLPKLLPAARTGAPPANSTNPSISILTSNDDQKEFYDRYATVLLDAQIARFALAKTLHPARTTTIGDGNLRVYSRVGNSLTSVQLQGPLSTRLMNSSLAQTALTSVDLSSMSSQSFGSTGTPSMEIPIERIDHLNEPIEGASDEEQKTRRVLAAFCHWWAGRPAQCYRVMSELAKAYPGDIELQIERARLASELGQPKLALEALDAFEPLDSNMLVRKEMAAMNLAAELGDAKRAKVAAERLFGMRLETQMQLALADQLRRLGLNDRADAMLQRMRSGRRKDERTQIQIAQAFSAAGDKQAAGEVAFSLLRRLSSGRTRNNNVTSYRRQAVQILESVGRLDPMIEQAKRRVESAPNSFRAKQQLADLYTAAGRSSDAAAVWDSVSGGKLRTAAQMLERAESLSKANKKDQAVKLYLDAFLKDPSRMNRDLYKLTNLVRNDQALIEQVFVGLKDLPIDAIPAYRLSDIIRIGGRNESDAFIDFLKQALKSNSAGTNFQNLVRNVDADVLNKLPEYREAMLSAVTDTNSFQPNANLWTVTSRSSGGRAIGPLVKVVDLLKVDEGARKKTREAAKSALSSEVSKAAGQFVSALVDYVEDDDDTAAIDAMRDALQSVDDPANAVPAGLVWQAGQILEANSNVPDSVAIEFFEYVQDYDTRRSSGSPRFGISARLISLYIKNDNKQAARRLLMDIAQTNFDRQNQFNPGYGDYQKIQSDQWVAEQLAEAGAVFEAWVIYQKSLSDPDQFERASRYSGSRDYQGLFKAAAEKAIEQIDADRAIEYLEILFDRWETGLKGNPIDLMELTPGKMQDSSSPTSSIMLVVKQIAQSDVRDAKINALLRRSSGLIDNNPDAWEPLGLHLILASQLTGTTTATDVADLTDRLMKRLPDIDQESSIDAIRYQSFKDLYPVASALVKSDDESLMPAGKQLVDYLTALGSATGDANFSIAVAGLKGDSQQVVRQMLDTLKMQLEPGQRPSATLVQQGLTIAENAARDGDIESAAAALRLSLGQGPPLQKIVTGGNAFAISSTRSSSSISAAPKPKPIDDLSERVDRLTQQFESALEIPLRTKPVVVVKSSSQRAIKNVFFPPSNDSDNAADESVAADPDSLPSQAEDSSASEKVFARETANKILDAYSAALMPAGQASVFLYQQPMVDESRRNNLEDSLAVSSIAYATCRLAVECDRVSELQSRIQAKFDAGEDTFRCSVVLLQLAITQAEQQIAAGDDLTNATWSEIETAMDRFVVSAGSRLPDSPSTTASSNNGVVIDSRTLMDAKREVQKINEVLPAVWPLVNSSLFAKRDAQLPARQSAKSKLKSVLKRIKTLATENPYLRSQLRKPLEQIEAALLSLAASSNERQDIVVGSIQKELGALQGLATSGSPQQVERQRWLRTVTLLDRSIRAGKLIALAGPMRDAFLSRKAGYESYLNRAEASFCLAVSRLPETSRLEWLTDFSLGSKPEDPIAYIAQRINFETPPRTSKNRMMRVNAVKALVSPHTDYMVVNTMTLLIDEAVRQGRGAELENKLESKRKELGDAADVSLAMLRIAQARGEGIAADDLANELQPTIDAVIESLQQNKPDKDDSTMPFPELETQLAFRLAKAKFPHACYAPLVRVVKPYAVRGKRPYLTATIARATARSGVGRAAGATKSGLPDDFVTVDIPRQQRGFPDRLGALYLVRKDGVISGTGGMGNSHLMFRYPLTGKFSIRANIKDGAWGEADLAYGGVMYKANGWKKTARVEASGNRGDVKFPVPSIQPSKWNQESIDVQPETVIAKCNGKSYVTDLRTDAFPFASIVHEMTRTTQVKDIQIIGDPVIPDEVNLIDPTLRGWSDLFHSDNLAKPFLPIGPDQDRDQILKSRKSYKATLAKKPLPDKWTVHDGELHFGGSGSGYTQLHYLRPLLDGESIEFEFWWDRDSHGFNFCLGRWCLVIENEGSRWGWMSKTSDLAWLTPSAEPEQKRELSDPEIVPEHRQWNTLLATRKGNEVTVTLNGKQLKSITVPKDELPAIAGYGNKKVRVRKAVLRGNWPDKVPARWLSE